jgi:hypothetical protein
MTTGQKLEALRVQLAQVHRELIDLVITSPVAPSPNSVKHDDYVRKLEFLEQRLRGMERSFGRMAGQGPAFYGSADDRFTAKQRQASFRDLVTAVETLLAQCFDELAAVLSPNKRLVVKGITDLGKKADEMVKMMRGDELFTSEIGHGGPGSSAPSTPGIDVSVSSFLTLAIVVIAAVKKAMNRGEK